MARSNETDASPTVSGTAAIRFVVVYLMAAFILMLSVYAVASDILIRGVAFPFAHGTAAVLAYRLTVASEVTGCNVDFDAVVERLAGTFALLAVLKHILLSILGSAATWLAGADRVLVWIVDVTFLNTSLLPDVAALGVFVAAVRAFETPGSRFPASRET